MVWASVIIPSCSSADRISPALESLANQSLCGSDYEVILVDNNSDDTAGHQRALERFGAQAKLVSLPRNQGYAGGCCQGVAVAQGEVFFFHNDDATLDWDWLAKVKLALAETPDLGVLSCVVLDCDQPVVQQAGAACVAANGLFWPIGKGDSFERSQVADRLVDVDFFGGCVWATPRCVWEDLGGLRTAYFPGYYEDTEYALRCRQAGYRIAIHQGVVCHHHSSRTLGFGSRAYVRAFHRSRWIYLLSNQTGWGWREILKAEWRMLRCASTRPDGEGYLSALAGVVGQIPECLRQRQKTNQQMGFCSPIRTGNPRTAG